MLAVAGVILAVLVVSGSALSLMRSKVWWVRVWDFPRLQLAVVGIVALALLGASSPWRSPVLLALGALAAAAVCFQVALVWRYTRLAPREVQRSALDDPARRLSLVVSNVLQTNREADHLLAVVREADPDVVLCVEADGWWRERLDALIASYPHTVQLPMDNTYGMLLYSRLPLERTSVDFLVEPDVPSMQAVVRLRGGQGVWLNCVHPRPPAPGESDESLERDAELLIVGRRVRDSALPVVVCGDLNDVAWSRTTRLFQKTSGLVDPRKGRGFFSTFHARWPGLRYPLDHVFHSTDFRLVAMRRLPYVGSDHFPMQAILSHEPQAGAEQSAPEADADDAREAAETVADARGTSS
ncbi:MAG TPA: endonuclease/exonuclease/phosphatase family protein [Gemmatimonadales bacterium]